MEGGRERGREGGREEEREGGREEKREGGRERGRQGGREGGKEGESCICMYVSVYCLVTCATYSCLISSAGIQPTATRCADCQSSALMYMSTASCEK